MKNKKLTYILIPAVCLIWVFIILKIINYRSHETEIKGYSNILATGNTKEIADTFTLLLDYPDPFLKTRHNGTTQSGNSKGVSQTTKKESTPLPRVKYYGLVINQKTTLEKINIQIDGKNYLMSPGDIHHGLQLNYIYGDSIKVSFDRIVYIIRK